MGIKSPCMDCKIRSIECHSECLKYNLWINQERRLKEEQKKNFSRKHKGY